MATRKSEIINKLANNYPNFIKRDLDKFINIILSEIRGALKRHERVELRDIFTLETKLQKAKYARNPKTNERIFVSEKYSVVFKTSKFWNRKLNEEK